MRGNQNKPTKRATMHRAITDKLHNHLQTQKRSQRKIKQNEGKQKAADMADFLRNRTERSDSRS